jgi:hypothetical protein
MNKNSWIVIGVVIALLVAVSIVFYYHYFKISPLSVVRHIFKVKEIYPTKPGGREWFINMDSPQSDRIFDPGSHITKQSDGSWQISGSFFQVRMVVGTPEGEKRWKNVEVTGYAKVLSADSSTDHLDWYARGGIHIRKDPCIGLAIKGTISIDGEVSMDKRDLA